MTNYCLICSISEEVGSSHEIFFWTLGPEWGGLVLSFPAALPTDRSKQKAVVFANAPALRLKGMSVN